MNRKFGIEIEAYGVDMRTLANALTAAGVPCAAESYNHLTRNHWKVVSDASLTGERCFELVSPVLHGVGGLVQVDTVCRVLNELGAKVNKSCGLHVHVDARDLGRDALARVCKMWMKYEQCFDAIVPASRRNNTYCRSNLANYGGDLDRAWKAIDEATGITGLISAMTMGCRYHKLNLQSMLRHGTVEFRQHSGTVDAAKITNWIGLVVGFVECAVEAKTIRKAGATKFENLLEVTDVPSIRKFYRERRVALAAV